MTDAVESVSDVVLLKLVAEVLEDIRGEDVMPVGVDGQVESFGDVMRSQ